MKPWQLLNTFTFSLMLAIAIASCKSNTQSDADVKYAAMAGTENNPLCLFRTALQRPLKICVTNIDATESDVMRVSELAREALGKWLQVLQSIDSRAVVTADVQICAPGSSADQVVEVHQGAHVPSSGPGTPMTVYTHIGLIGGGGAEPVNLGSIVHEFGHSFACLADRYMVSAQGIGIAGQCVENVPSIMCDNFKYDAPQQDDINGLRNNYSTALGGGNIAQTFHNMPTGFNSTTGMATNPTASMANPATNNAMTNPTLNNAMANPFIQAFNQQTPFTQLPQCPFGGMWDTQRFGCFFCPTGLVYNQQLGRCNPM